jgi:hypothetical protein
MSRKRDIRLKRITEWKRMLKNMRVRPDLEDVLSCDAVRKGCEDFGLDYNDPMDPILLLYILVDVHYGARDLSALSSFPAAWLWTPRRRCGRPKKTDKARK